jgi:ferredoxin-NADP reductase
MMFQKPLKTPDCSTQIIKAVLKDAEDTTQLSLLYANVSPDDILLREELDELAAQHPNFKVWYTGARRRRVGGACDRAGAGQRSGTGMPCTLALQ